MATQRYGTFRPVLGSPGGALVPVSQSYMTRYALRLSLRTDTEVDLKYPFVDRTPHTRRITHYSAVSLLRGYNVLTSRTLGPHALCAVVLLVLNENPCFGYVLTTFRAPTEGRFISVHAKGWKERVTVPSQMNITRLEPKLLAAFGPNAPGFRWSRPPARLTNMRFSPSILVG